MWPMAYAMVSTVNPNASETPSKPIPTFGNVKRAQSPALSGAQHRAEPAITQSPQIRIDRFPGQTVNALG